MDVVLVHGFLDTADLFRPMNRALTAVGHRVHVIDLKPNHAATGIVPLASQLADFVEAQGPSDQPCALVGFSMGGIVGRYYLQRLGGIERVHRFIAIASPHHGTWLAKLLPLQGPKDMSPGSDLLDDLNKTQEELLPLDPVSFWTPYDLMILPQSSARMGVGRSRRFDVPLHALMASDRGVIKGVLGELGSL